MATAAAVAATPMATRVVTAVATTVATTVASTRWHYTHAVFCFQICMCTFFVAGGYGYGTSQAAASQPPSPKGLAMRVCTVQFILHTFFCAMPIQFILFWAGAAQASEPNAAGLSGFLIAPFFKSMLSNFQVYFPYFSARTTQGSEEWPWERASKRPWERACKRP